MIHSDNLGWIDLEMTGLDVDSCTIIEIAVVVTNAQLEVIATGPNIAIHQNRELMSQMDEWNTSHHGDSGLTKRVIESTVSMQEAEQQTIDFLAQYLDLKKSPLCGNSVHQDRIFLSRYMQKLHDFFHYRNLDVSTIKELSYRWYPEFPKFEKKGSHLALDDILESIGELKYYREHLFK